jgi:glycine/D-amino acid oxidase-like deaminating enzyme
VRARVGLGTQTSSQRALWQLVERIGADRVHLASPVVEVRRRRGPAASWDGPRPIAIVTASGSTYWCDHVVLGAASPSPPRAPA